MTNLGPTFLKEIFILAGNKDNHKSWDEFEFQPDPISYYGVLKSVE